MNFRFLYHISDIHIRLYSRRNEYLEVFEKLYDYIRTDSIHKGKHQCLIVVTGDVLHNKIDLQPECTLMTYQFLKELSSLLPTILIAGNHDALLNNRDRIDSLTSILHERTPEDLYYYTATGIYRHGNILFVVNSVLDDKPWISSSDVIKSNTTDISIALYHGQLYGWKNNGGYESEFGEKHVHDFEGFDFVLLGDIHKHQYMNREKTIGYAGSLISQNYGETDDHHGILRWDIREKSSQFIPLENPYSYREYRVMGDGQSEWLFEYQGVTWDIDSVPIPMYGNVKLYYDSHYLQFPSMMKKRYSTTKFQFKPIDATFLEGSLSTEYKKEHMGMISDETCIIDYVNEKWVSESSVLREQMVKDLLSDFHGQQRCEEMTRHVWEIEYIRFENLFGYGKSNEIRFTLLPKHTVTGVFGKNSVGKSTLIDIISFLLYGKITRGTHGNTIPREVIHFQEKEGYGEIGIRLGCTSYIMKKVCHRNHLEKIKIIETLYEVDEKGNRKQLTDEQRKKTDKIVQRMIGGYKSFLYTNLFLQQREESFRDMKQASRKDFLYELFGLNWFEKYRKQKEDEMKCMRGEQRLLLSRIETMSRRDWETNMIQLTEKKQSKQKELEELKEMIRDHQTEKEACYRRLRHCSFSDKNQILQQEQSIHTQLNSVMETITHYRSKKKKSELFLSKYDVDELQEKAKRLSLSPSQDSDDTGCYNQDLLLKYSPYMNPSISLSEWEGIMKTIKEMLPSSSILSREWEMKKDALIDDMKQLLSSRPSYDPLQLLQENDWVKAQDTYTQYQSSFTLIQEELQDTESKLLEYRDKECFEISTRLLELDKRIQERNMIKCKYDMEKQQLSKDEHISYNKDCEHCMKNPHYLERKQNVKSFQLLKKEFQTIDQACKACWISLKDIYPRKIDQAFASWNSLLDYIKSDLQQYQQQYQDLLERQRDLQKEVDAYHRWMTTFRNTEKYKESKKIEQKIAKLEKQIQTDPLYIKYQQVMTLVKDLDTYHYIDDLWKAKSTTNPMSLQEVQECIDQYHEYSTFLQTCDDQLNALETQLVTLNVKKETLKVDMRTLSENEHINQAIREYQHKIQALELRITRCEKECYDIHEKLQSITVQFTEWEKNERSYHDVCRSLSYLEKLMAITERDGLPLHLLKMKLPIIERDINGLLSVFLDKKLILRVEEKDVLVGIDTRNKCEEKEKMTVTNYLGGMESFIIDLSLKLGFSKFANLPRSNFFIIDEGISVMDQERIGNISHLFDFLSNITDHVMLISHLPTIKDFVQQSIEVMKDESQKSHLVMT